MERTTDDDNDEQQKNDWLIQKEKKITNNPNNQISNVKFNHPFYFFLSYYSIRESIEHTLNATQ